MHPTVGALALSGLRRLPDGMMARVYQTFADESLRRDGPGWRIETGAGSWVVPRPRDALRVTHKGGGYQRKLDRYLVGPISLDAGDRVIDVGAMIGEFARGVEREYGADVTAIEPDPVSAACLRETIDGDVLERVAWYRQDEVEFQVADDHSESGVFEPDAGDARTVRGQAARVDQLIDGPVDLLKLDAEGAEPEVLLGTTDLDIRQIAVDVSAERAGASPASIVTGLLLGRGFDVSRHGDILVGVRDVNGGESA